MYWLKDGVRISSPAYPFVVKGQNYDCTLTLVTGAGEELKRTSLCVINSADVGILSAKLSSEEEYKTIGGFFDPTCFLGHMAAETETEIDFRINAPETESDGQKIVAVMVCYGSNAPIPELFFNDDDSYFSDNDSVWVN